MKKSLSEAIGWIGAVFVVLAYALLNFKVLTSNNLFYILLNITGSIGIAYISLKKKTYQPAVVNIIWALIALFGLISIMIK